MEEYTYNPDGTLASESLIDHGDNINNTTVYKYNEYGSKIEIVTTDDYDHTFKELYEYYLKKGY